MLIAVVKLGCAAPDIYPSGFGDDILKIFSREHRIELYQEQLKDMEALAVENDKAFARGDITKIQYLVRLDMIQATKDELKKFKNNFLKEENKDKRSLEELNSKD